MGTPQLYARPKSKSGDRVLCAVKYCRGELGVVLSTKEKPDDQPTRWLNLPQGWAKGDDAVYRLTNYAREKIRRGRPPQLRHRPKGMQMPNSNVTVTPKLPCVAECPVCRRSQILDPSRLDVVPVSTEMRTGWPTEDLKLSVYVDVGKIPGGNWGYEARMRELQLREKEDRAAFREGIEKLYGPQEWEEVENN